MALERGAAVQGRAIVGGHVAGRPIGGGAGAVGGGAGAVGRRVQRRAPAGGGVGGGGSGAHQAGGGVGAGGGDSAKGRRSASAQARRRRRLPPNIVRGGPLEAIGGPIVSAAHRDPGG